VAQWVAEGIHTMPPQHLVVDISEPEVRVVASGPYSSYEKEELLHMTFEVAPDKPKMSVCFRIAQSRVFDPFILSLIILSSVCLAVETPYTQTSGYVGIALSFVDTVSVLVFTFEMLVKMRAFGVCKPPFFLPPGAPGTYFRSTWNWIDFFCVVTGLTDSMLTLFSSGSSLKVVRTMRVMRVLRPLKLVRSYEGIRTIVEGLLNSVETLVNLMIITLLFYLGFGILFVNLLKGQLWYCSLDPTGELMPDLETRADCEQRGGVWMNRESNFDNIGYSMLTLLHMSTGEGWLEMLVHIVDSRGVDLQPRRNAREYMAILVCAFVSLSNFCILNLFIGVLVDHYQTAKAKYNGTELLDQVDRLWLHMQGNTFLNSKIVQRLTADVRLVQLDRGCGRWCRDAVESRAFDVVILALILGNTVLLCLDDPTASAEFASTSESLSTAFVLAFNVEAAMKLYVYRSGYFQDSWNALDLLVVIGSDVSIVAGFALGGKGSVVQGLRAFRVGRVLRLARYVTSLEVMINTLVVAVPGLLNATGLLGLVIFLYSCLGVGLFGTTAYGPEITESVNFQNFCNSAFLLLRAATGESWHLVMYAFASEQPGCTGEVQTPEKLQSDGPRGCGSAFAYPFFITFELLVVLVMMNLIIAVLVDSFSQVQQKRLLCFYSKQVDLFVEAWESKDKPFIGYLHLDVVADILLKIAPPVGFQGSKRKRVLHSMRPIRLFDGDTVHFRDVLMLCAQRGFLWLREEPERDIEKVRFQHDVLADWISLFPDVPFGDGYKEKEKPLLVAHFIIASHVHRFVDRKRIYWRIRRLAEEEEKQKQLQKRNQPQHLPIDIDSPPDAIADAFALLQDTGAGVGIFEDMLGTAQTVPIAALPPLPAFDLEVEPPSPALHLEVDMPNLSPLPWPPPMSRR